MRRYCEDARKLLGDDDDDDCCNSCHEDLQEFGSDLAEIEDKEGNVYSVCCRVMTKLEEYFKRDLSETKS